MDDVGTNKEAQSYYEDIDVFTTNLIGEDFRLASQRLADTLSKRKFGETHFVQAQSLLAQLRPGRGVVQQSGSDTTLTGNLASHVLEQEILFLQANRYRLQPHVLFLKMTQESFTFSEVAFPLLVNLQKFGLFFERHAGKPFGAEDFVSLMMQGLAFSKALANANEFNESLWSRDGLSFFLVHEKGVLLCRAREGRNGDLHTQTRISRSRFGERTPTGALREKYINKDPLTEPNEKICVYVEGFASEGILWPAQRRAYNELVRIFVDPNAAAAALAMFWKFIDPNLVPVPKKITWRDVASLTKRAPTSEGQKSTAGAKEPEDRPGLIKKGIPFQQSLIDTLQEFLLGPIWQASAEEREKRSVLAPRPIQPPRPR